tara:strand:+ start:556 stop:789 length:234 start_codon:yes stop_codon:yes gene_type:complete
MDEMYTRINGKRRWITYAINRKTKQVIDFVVGRRSNDTISKVVNTVHSCAIYPRTLARFCKACLIYFSICNASYYQK